MITDYQADILSFIESCQHDIASIGEIRAKFGPDAPVVADLMAQDGLLEFILTRDSFHLQAKGRQALAEHRLSLQYRHQKENQHKAEKQQEKLEDRAYQEDQNRKSNTHDYLVAGFAAVVGFLLGVIAQHEADLFQRLLRVLGM